MIMSLTRRLRLLGILQGMPERCSVPAFVRHSQAGAGFESQPDDDDDDDDRDSGADSAPSIKHTYG